MAELYEPLLSERASADDYAPFLSRSGEPALELGCGSGIPLLELVQRGFDVEGLDSSADMLARCREKAQALGLAVTLHHQEMEHMALPRRYRSMFLAGATFTLLPTEDHARAALRRMHEHLLPGGSALVPLTMPPDFDRIEAGLGRFRETRAADGALLRVGLVASTIDRAARTVCSRLRYEREHPGGRLESLERDWVRRWWDQTAFQTLLNEAGFARATALRRDGSPAEPGDALFVFLAQRSP